MIMLVNLEDFYRDLKSVLELQPQCSRNLIVVGKAPLETSLAITSGHVAM